MPRKPISSATRCDYEAANWVSCRFAGGPTPTVAEAATAGAHQDLPPNFRWSLQGEQVVLLGDLRGDAAELPVLKARRRLENLAHQLLPPLATLDRTEVGCALNQLGLNWEQADETWRAAVSWHGGSRCELTAELTPAGVQISAVLADWNGDLDNDCRQAVARFVCLANARLRFVRVVVDAHQVRAESSAMADRLDAELEESVSGTIAAFSAVAREVRALLMSDLARAYLATVWPNAEGTS